MSELFNKNPETNEAQVNGLKNIMKKPYVAPALTEYGRMADLTQAGGGDGPNDGDLYPGSPIVPGS